MAGRDRIPIFPSRANSVFIKNRILSAAKGLSLLKRKRDALEMKLREYSAELKKLDDVVHKDLEDAIFSIAKANFLCTDFKPTTVINMKQADLFLFIRHHKMVGLLLPRFELVEHPANSYPLTGLSHGGVQVELIRDNFRRALKGLIGMASLQYSVKILTEGVKQNNMRVNGLEYVVIPRFVNTVNYIRDELDEYEREDFYRLKRSQANQRKARENFSELIRSKYPTDEAFDMRQFEQSINRTSIENKTDDVNRRFIELQKELELEELRAPLPIAPPRAPTSEDEVEDEEEDNGNNPGQPLA